MATIYDARSVNPDQVTDAQIDEVFAEHGVTRAPNGLLNFFKPGVTYRRGRDTFRCAAVGTETEGRSMALGYMPVNIAGTLGWEVMWQISADWPRWTEVTD